MVAIVSVSENWGIGKDGAMLFRNPIDMKFFRTTTTGGTVIMGRKTLESFPEGKPLKNRRNIVISTKAGYAVEGAEVVTSPAQALSLVAGEPEGTVFIIGGGEVYRAMLPLCQKALVTRTRACPEADRFFPDLDAMDDWQLADESEEQDYEGLKFRFCTYVRK